MKLVIAFICFAVFAGVLYAQEGELKIVMAPRDARPRGTCRRLQARYAPTELKVDTSTLSAGDKKALVKLLEAARVLGSTVHDPALGAQPCPLREVEEG